MSTSGREGGAGQGGHGDAASEKQVCANQVRETPSYTKHSGAGLFPAGLLRAFNVCLYKVQPARQMQWLRLTIWEPLFLFFLFLKKIFFEKL